LEVKKIAPEIKIGFLYSAGLVEPWEYAKRLGAEAIHPLYISIPPEAIKACNENKVLVNPYTIDIPEHIKFAALAGVDGIITNVPDVAIEVLDGLA
jgi:glycerophosphoryl diester phosphodiesterase